MLLRVKQASQIASSEIMPRRRWGRSSGCGAVGAICLAGAVGAGGSVGGFAMDAEVKRRS